MLKLDRFGEASTIRPSTICNASGPWWAIARTPRTPESGTPSLRTVSEPCV